MPTELARRYVWNSFSEFIGRAAQAQPLLLVLEDLHWADESTLLLTEYLAPLLPEMPVLVLGTYRDVEMDLQHPLARVIGQLGRRRLVERINLRRLSFDGVRAMLQALAGQPASDQLARIIDRETEGNPFFVEEVYLHLVESGVLLDEHGRVRADLELAEVSVPDSIRLVLMQRLSHLSASTHEVLVAAAVSGRVFTSEIVGEVAGASDDTLVDAFDEAERARLITPGKIPGELMFSHELIRQTLLSGVSAIKREQLHQQAAEAISRLYSDDLEAHAGDLAYHLSHAGPLRQIGHSLVRYLTIAGERAFDAAAFDDAVDYFEQALSLIPTDDQLGRAQLLERLSMALRSVGRWDDALRTMNDALDRYQTLGRGGGNRSVGLGHGVPAGVDCPVCRGSAGRPADACGTRQHRQRGQGPPAIRARRLPSAWAATMPRRRPPSTRRVRSLSRWATSERLPTCCTCRPSTISATPSSPRESGSACRPPRRSSGRARCGISVACRRS